MVGCLGSNLEVWIIFFLIFVVKLVFFIVCKNVFVLFIVCFEVLFFRLLIILV